MALTNVAQQQFAQIMSSEAQQHHAEEKEGLMMNSRVSEETDITLLEHIDLDDDNDDREKGRGGNARRRRSGPRLGPVWLWAVQAGVFFTSFMFFILGATMGPTTGEFVRQFSAYCEWSYMMHFGLVWSKLNEHVFADCLANSPRAGRG